MIVAGGLFALAVAAFGVIAAVVDRVRNSTVKNTDDEVVPADVQGQASSLGLTPDVLALARVGASEAGGQKRSAKIAVMWVVVNAANLRELGPIEVVLGSADTFGPQGSGGRGFVASSKDQQQVDVDIATGVMAGDIDDNTGGALHFDSPRSYKDKLDATGNVVQTAQQRADAFAAARQSEGFSLFVLDDVAATTFRFWRKEA